MAQPRQGATNDGTAHTENLAQRLFTQFGTRRQPLFQNGIEDMFVNDIVLRDVTA